MSWWQGDLPTQIGLAGWTQNWAALEQADDAHHQRHERAFTVLAARNA